MDLRSSDPIRLTGGSDSFFDVFFAIQQNDARRAFRSNATGLRHLARARRMGFRDLLRDSEVHAVAGALDKGVDALLANLLHPPLTGGGLPAPKLRAAANALRAGGKKLDAIRRRHGDGNYLGVLSSYKTAFNALTGNAAR